MRVKNSRIFIIALAAALSAGLLATSGPAGAQGDVTAETGYRKLRDPNMFGTIKMQRTTRDMEDTRAVLFPHWSHRTEYTCNVCHADGGTPMKAGETVVTHAELDAGESCGACHDGTVAFSTQESCDRCHSYGIEVYENSNAGRALSDLPPNEFGNQVDWAEAMRQRRIQPKTSVADGGELETRKTEIVIPVTKFKPAPPDVMFPHEIHTAQIKCATCHPEPFTEEEGGNPEMSMLRIMTGDYCGKCHGRVAFPLGDCFRCHSQPVPEPEEDEE